ncbi:MAG: hypothetical protein WD049_04510 [Candidatus Paceibacterota bacterium]
MALKLNERTCVARGTFNIYIFQPDWFVKIMELDEDTEGQILADFSQPGLRVRFQDGELIWTIRPDSIILTSSSSKRSVGDLVSKVLHKLPHTPMRAVGNNFTFSNKLEDLGPQDDAAPTFWLEPSRVPGLLHSDIGGAIKRGDAVYNLAISRTETDLRLVANVHRETKTCEAAEEAANKFNDDFDAIVEMASSLFSLEVNDGNG